MTRSGLVGKALLTCALAIGLTPVLGVNPAHACSCLRATEMQLYQRADVVFKGKVTDTEFPPGFGSNPNASPIVYTMKATRDYKGKVRRTMTVRTAGNGALCGVRLGKRPFVVFADKDRKGRLSVSLCSGTRPFHADDKPYFAPGTKVR